MCGQQTTLMLVKEQREGREGGKGGKSTHCRTLKLLCSEEKLVGKERQHSRNGRRRANGDPAREHRRDVSVRGNGARPWLERKGRGRTGAAHLGNHAPIAAAAALCSRGGRRNLGGEERSGGGGRSQRGPAPRVAQPPKAQAPAQPPLHLGGDLLGLLLGQLADEHVLEHVAGVLAVANVLKGVGGLLAWQRERRGHT